MNNAKTLILCLLFFLFPLSGLAEISNASQKDIRRAENYLENLKTLTADFIQTSPDGYVATGRFYLKRPGHLCFAYQTPNKDFIVADGRLIYYWDSELEQQSHTLISRTMAHFILRKNIYFRDDITILNTQYIDKALHLTLAQSNDPEAGTLTLIFQKDPFVLKGWVVKDMEERTTKIMLHRQEMNQPIDKNLFYFRKPHSP